MRTAFSGLWVGLTLLLLASGGEVYAAVPLDLSDEGVRRYTQRDWENLIFDLKPGDQLLLPGRSTPVPILAMVGTGDFGLVFRIPCPEPRPFRCVIKIAKDPLRAGSHSLSSQVDIMRRLGDLSPEVLDGGRNQYLIMREVEGIRVSEARMLWSRPKDAELHRLLAGLAIDLRINGNLPDDLHGGNLMIDQRENRILVVDPGNLRRPSIGGGHFYLEEFFRQVEYRNLSHGESIPVVYRAEAAIMRAGRLDETAVKELTPSLSSSLIGMKQPEQLEGIVRRLRQELSASSGKIPPLIRTFSTMIGKELRFTHELLNRSVVHEIWELLQELSDRGMEVGDLRKRVQSLVSAVVTQDPRRAIRDGLLDWLLLKVHPDALPREDRGPIFRRILDHLTSRSGMRQSLRDGEGGETIRAFGYWIEKLEPSERSPELQAKLRKFLKRAYRRGSPAVRGQLLVLNERLPRMGLEGATVWLDPSAAVEKKPAPGWLRYCLGRFLN